jgi:transcriptional regulator with XRE-family HTH domain
MSTITHREATPGGAMAYIKRVREERGIQAKVVAGALGISPSQYSQMEGNQSDGYLPSPGKLAIIVEILGIRQEDVIRAAGYLRDADAGDARQPVTLPAGLVRQVIEKLTTFDELLNEGLAEVAAMVAAMEASEDQRRQRGEQTRGRHRAIG